MDKPYHQRAEMAELRFLAPDPIWRGETEEAAALTAAQTLSPVNGMALRNADGTWSSLGGGVAAGTPARFPYAVEQLLDGRIVVGGTGLLDFGGTAANDNFAVWDGSAWATLGGNAPNAMATAAVLGADGVLYLAGDFTTIGGASINRIAQWTPGTNSWTTVGTGGASAAPVSLAIEPATGYLWCAGYQMTTLGGVTVNSLGYWNGSTWVAATTGLPGGWAVVYSQALAAGPDGRIYLANSGTSPGIYVWTGSTWALFAASTGAAYCLLSARGRLYVGGSMTVVGGVTVSRIAELSASGVSSMGGGTSGGIIYTLASTPDGRVHVAGSNWTTIGGITPPDTIASWSGSAWSPFAANPPDTGTHANDVYIVRSVRDGSLVFGWYAASGTFGTSLTADAITSVTNSGSANAYPVLDLAGPATLYSLTNLTTGQQIAFSNCVLGSAETARLDLRPGRKTFGTALRSLNATLLPGSDRSSFCLAPGVNRIALFFVGGTATLRWQPRYWGAD